MTDACTNAPTHSRKPCCKRLSRQKETDQTSTHCINVWSNYGAPNEDKSEPSTSARVIVLEPSL